MTRIETTKQISLEFQRIVSETRAEMVAQGVTVPVDVIVAIQRAGNAQVAEYDICVGDEYTDKYPHYVGWSEVYAYQLQPGDGWLSDDAMYYGLRRILTTVGGGAQ